MWQQKARLDWVKYRDANTKFYHVVVKGKQRRSKILALKKGDDTWCYDQVKIKSKVLSRLVQG